MLRLLMHCVPPSASEHEWLHAFEQLRRTDRACELIEQEREGTSWMVDGSIATGGDTVSNRNGD